MSIQKYLPLPNLAKGQIGDTSHACLKAYCAPFESFDDDIAQFGVADDLDRFVDGEGLLVKAGSNQNAIAGPGGL